MGIRFRPGIAAGLLPIPLEEITDHSVPLDDIWPVQGRELNEQLADNGSIQEKLILLSQKLRFDEIRVTAQQKAIDAIVEAHGQLDLETLARQAGLSLRQLRRRCREYTGLSPKLLCRILRFRDALSQLEIERGAHLAAGCGYYDQTHFIDDFREFSGSTPNAFLQLRQER